MPRPPVKICFVCLGNICRSPTAEGIMKKLVADAGLSDAIVVESAGTGAWHVGEPADARTRAAAQKRGVLLTGRGRQFLAAHFADYDYVVAMDNANLRHLEALAPDTRAAAKLALCRSFDPAALPGAGVPDPYYGGEDGFDQVFAICEAACRHLLRRLRETHGL